MGARAGRPHFGEKCAGADSGSRQSVFSRFVMWSPTVLDLLQLHIRVCAVQDVPATGSKWRQWMRPSSHRSGKGRAPAPERVATECAAILEPIVCRRSFEHCNDRVAHSLAQKFADRNGCVLGASIDDVLPVFEHM